MRLRMAVAIVLASAGLAGTAQADVIDFRDDAWGPGGTRTHTVGGTTVEALPCVTVLGFSDCPTLNWDDADGFGVDSDYFGLPIDREDDEINNYEVLRVSFNGGAQLTGFLLTDLFYESGQSEVAYYSLNGGAWTSVAAPLGNLPGSTNGELWVTLPVPVFVSSISFGFGGLNLLDTRNDFAVGAVNVNNRPAAVPEPTSLLLFGAGLAAVGVARRRQQA